MDLSLVDISHLSFGMAGFHPKTAAMYDLPDHEIDEDMVIDSRFYSPLPEDKGKSVIRFQPKDLLFLSPVNNNISIPLVLKQISSNIPKCKFVTAKQVQYYSTSISVTSPTTFIDKSEVPSNDTVENKTDSCTECHKPQVLPLVKHFLQSNKPVDEKIKCPFCMFIAPTNCCLQAHIRIHKNLSPFVCPECGKSFETSQSLHDHMLDVCFHFVKRVKLQCPAQRCRKLFTQKDTFAAHFYVHFQTYQHCSLCQLNLYSSEEKENHAKTHETDQPCLEQKLKCTVCSACLTSSLECKKHIEEHSSDNEVRVYVYICSWCKGNFRSTLTYNEHLKKCSKRTADCYKIQILNDTNHSDKHYFSVCFKCNVKNYVLFSSPQQYDKCKDCDGKLIIVPVEQKIVMLDTAVETSKSKHVNKCLLCLNVFPADELILHAKKCKYCNPVVRISVYDKHKVDNSKRAISEQPEDKTKKKRKINANPVSCDDVDLEAETPVPFDGTYRCQFCDYSDTDRKEFHNHIKSHKEISTTYQCMECGNCFVVKLSLTRHLIYFHQVTDTEKYFEENDCFDKEASKEHSKENQCSVCMREFSDERELNNHFRIHGMAFLQCSMK